MKIPFFGLDRQYLQHREKFLAIIDRVLTHAKVLQGPEVAEFEHRVAAACGTRHAVAVNSCTDALAYALTAVGVKPGDRVAVSAFSFVASASCILRVGATPVFIDVDPDSGLMDPAELAARLTPDVKAVIAVHLYGQTVNLDDIYDIARERKAILIEDAAQSLGARYRNRPAGSFGRCACVSFDPTKVISAAGSGGALVTDDEAFAQAAREMRYHGKRKDERSWTLGFNSQMPTLTAALLAYKMEFMDTWAARRQAIADRYTRALKNVQGIRPMPAAVNRTHIQHKYVLQSDRRDALKSHLAADGVETKIHYSVALPDEPVFKSAAAQDCPNARTLAGRVLSLPIYPELEDEEVDYITESIQNFADTNPTPPVHPQPAA